MSTIIPKTGSVYPIASAVQRGDQILLQERGGKISKNGCYLFKVDLSVQPEARYDIIKEYLCKGYQVDYTKVVSEKKGPHSINFDQLFQKTFSETNGITYILVAVGNVENRFDFGEFNKIAKKLKARLKKRGVVKKFKPLKIKKCEE